MMSNDTYKMNFQWDQQVRLGNDPSAVTVSERESRGPGLYQLEGFDPTRQNMQDYTTRMGNRVHFQKQYANT